MTAELEETLRALAALARADARFAGAALVGGAVRDALLGRPLHDIDVVVAVDAPAFAAAAAAVAGSHVVPIGERFGVLRVPLADGVLDVAPLRGDLREDLAARDCTVNALAVPLRRLPAEGPAATPRAEVVDPLGGLADLDARVLRLTGPETLGADVLRALRIIRLAVELGFDVEPSTLRALREPEVHAALGRVAGERVGAELQRWFAAPAAGRGARLADATGLLGVCFPALEEGRGVEQHPHLYTVLEHQLVALECMDVLLAEAPPAGGWERPLWAALWGGERWGDERWGDVREHLREHAGTLRLATLLHDAGKPATRTFEPDGRTRFFGHADLGAALATEMLRRWRFPTRTVERVALLVEQHLRPGQINAPGEPPTPAALHRFHRVLGDAAPEVCFLFLADSLATTGPEVLLPRWPAYIEHVRRIVLWEPSAAARRVRGLVDGHAVMQATGLPPGPAVGRILAALDEAAATGEVDTPEAALALAKRLAEAERAGDDGHA